MAGKNGGTSFTSTDVAMMHESFGTLMAHVNKNFDTLMQEFESVATKDDPFPDCDQKEPVKEAFAALKKAQERITTALSECDKTMKEFTTAYEDAFTKQLAKAKAATTAVTQAAARVGKQ